MNNIEFSLDAQYSIEQNPDGGFILKKVFKRNGKEVINRWYGTIPILCKLYIEKKMESKSVKSKKQIKSVQDFLAEYNKINNKVLKALKSN